MTPLLQDPGDLLHHRQPYAAGTPHGGALSEFRAALLPPALTTMTTAHGIVAP